MVNMHTLLHQLYNFLYVYHNLAKLFAIENMVAVVQLCDI